MPGYSWHKKQKSSRRQHQPLLPCYSPAKLPVTWLNRGRSSWCYHWELFCWHVCCIQARTVAPTLKIVLPAAPKFEPFYVSLQVAAQSDATYVPGYSWHVNKRVPDGNINYSCHGTAQPSYQLLGREGHLWQWGHLWKQNYWQYSLQADNSFHRPNSNSHPGRYTGSAYTSAWRVLTFVWS